MQFKIKGGVHWSCDLHQNESISYWLFPREDVRSLPTASSSAFSGFILNPDIPPSCQTLDRF